MMINQKGAIFLIVAGIFTLVWLCIMDNPSNSAMEQYKDEYVWYLEHLNGKCTDENSEFLENEAQNISEARKKQEIILADYYDGKITENIYIKTIKENEKVLEHQNGFEVIYKQYLYICENMENRYFLQTNGWEGLFGNGTLQMFLFLGILLFATPVFCSEYSCHMDALILTSKMGIKSCRIKILLMFGIVVFFCLELSLMEYVFYDVRYGLFNGNFPIQSISCFSTCTKSLSLFQGYMLVVLFRCLGALFLATLLLFFSVVVKKYALTVMLGVSFILIPYIGLDKKIIYRLPMPLPFLLARDFLMGTIIEKNGLTGTEKVLFEEIEPNYIFMLIILSVLVCVMAVLWILRKSSNRWDGHKKLKSSIVIILITVFITNLVGCSNYNQDEFIVYNSNGDKGCLEYEIMQNEVTRKLYLKNESMEEWIEVVRSPIFGMFSEEENIMSYFGNSQYLYYSTLVTENYIDRIGQYNEIATKVAIVELNVDTMEETVIFEQMTDSGRSIFGINYDVGDRWKFLEYHKDFFLNDENIFFVEDKGITKINRKTNKVQNIDIPTNGNLAFDGVNIFYINENAILTKYNTDNKETFLFDNVIASDFCIYKNGFYFVSRTDSYRVYECDLAGENVKIVYGKPALAVEIKDGNVYVVLRENGEEITIGE